METSPKEYTETEKRHIRREKLDIIRAKIAELVKDQKDVKEVLREPHTGYMGMLQMKLEENRTKITSLHDLSHEIRETGSHHGTKRKHYYAYRIVREGLWKTEIN